MDDLDALLADLNSTPKPKPLHGSSGDGNMDTLSHNLEELGGLLADLDSKSRNLSTSHQVPEGNGYSGDESGHGNLAKETTQMVSTVEDLLDDLDNAVLHPQTTVQIQPVGGRASYSAEPVGRTASNATKELDELMHMLSDFKVNVQTKSTNPADAPQQPEPGPVIPITNDDYAQVDKKPDQPAEKSGSSSPPPVSLSPPSPAGNLESMLGSLQTNMSKQGVSSVTKGTCAACNKPIIGQVCTALGRTWHPEHFSCVICERPLGTCTFFERDGNPYCEECYHEQYAPKCFGCKGPILESCVTSMDRTWHPLCFVCAECKKPFGEAGFHEKDGKAYCREDYFKMFAPKCAGCNEAIIDNYISALSGHWHPQCFACMECHQPFQSGSFFEHEGMPYCEMHYHARRGSLCYSCQKPITGRCITAMRRKFHPEHFLCAFCLKQLNKGTFKEMNDKPYCHPCFIKLFG